jgi:peroxiredoxin
MRHAFDRTRAPISSARLTDPRRRVRTALGLAVLLLAASARDAPAVSAQAAPPAQTADSAPRAASAAPAAKSAGAAKATLKRPAPDFTLQDLDGKKVSLRALRGKVVVLEWFNPDCPFVKFSHSKGPLRELAKQLGSAKLVWLSINSGGAGKQGNGLDRNRAAKSEYGIENTILLDETGAVGHLYGAEKTPHLFVIDVKGRLVYRGGLDNAPMGVVDDARPRSAETKPGELEPYLQKAIEDLEKKRALRLSETPAYGCSVKYEAS